MRVFTLKPNSRFFFVLLLASLLLPLSLLAQKLEVVSLEDAVIDNTAWNPSTCHKLEDGRYCPVIKVEFNQPACVFEGGIFEGKKPLYKTNEYWVYMLPGARHIIIKHPNFEKIDVFFDEVNPNIVRLQEKHTYVMKLKGEIKKGLESVEKGEASSMLKMAQNYEYGTGEFNKDLNQALIWYEKAAEAGSVEAQEKLAIVLCEFSSGFKRSPSKALHWNDVLAKKGNIDAVLRMARLYEEDNCKQQAISCYVKYNEIRPHRDLQFKIAQLYNTTPEKNKWLKIAADNGHAEAAYELATRLAQEDSQTAAIYYQKAIDSGHLQAMSEYGTILMTGKFGFAKDEQKAKVLLNRAVSNGSFVAKSSMLSTTDPQLFNYVALIPDLLQKVKGYDTDAMLTLILIYRALNETVLAEQMRVVAMYYLNSEDISKKEQLDHTLLRLAGVSGRDKLITSRKEFQKTVYPNGRRSYTMNYNHDTKRTRNNYIEYLLEDFGFSEYWLGKNDTERNAEFFANLSLLKRFIDGIEKEEVIPLFGSKEIIYREKRFTFYSLLSDFPNLDYQEAIINLEKIKQKKQLTKKEKYYKDYYSKRLKKLNKEQGIQKDSWLLRLKSEGFFKIK